MTINKTTDSRTLTVAPSGRLDTSTAPALEAELKDSLSGIGELILDLKELEYISSAGLAGPSGHSQSHEQPGADGGPQRQRAGHGGL